MANEENEEIILSELPDDELVTIEGTVGMESVTITMLVSGQLCEP